MYGVTDQEMMDRFGTTTPSIAHRTKYFYDLWVEYGEENELNLRDLNLGTNYAKFSYQIRTTYGFFDVVRRGLKIRVKDRALLSYIKLAYS